jgi:hypothetical protein
MKTLLLLLLVPAFAMGCCKIFKRTVPKPPAPPIAKKQEEKKKDDAAQLHSFMKEVTDVDVAKSDLKVEIKDVEETLVAIGLNEGAKLVAKSAVTAVL